MAGGARETIHVSDIDVAFIWAFTGGAEGASAVIVRGARDGLAEVDDRRAVRALSDGDSVV